MFITINDRLSAAALIYIFPVKDAAFIREWHLVFLSSTVWCPAKCLSSLRHLQITFSECHSRVGSDFLGLLHVCIVHHNIISTVCV